MRLSQLRLASLVFAHALFEALIHDLLDVARLSRRCALLQRIADRKLPIRFHLDGGMEEALTTLLVNCIDELKRGPLTTKLEVLLQVFRCRSALDAADAPMNLARITAIDRERQRILHGGPFAAPATATISADLDFLQSQGNLFVGIVATNAALEVSVVELCRLALVPRSA